jgi:hypothetical protein
MIDNQPKLDQSKYTSVKDFYPVYLTQHQNTVNRILHFIGTGLFGLLFITAMLFHNVIFFALMPVAAFSFSWIGHIVFEKNKPGKLKYLFYTLMSDFILFGDLMMGRQPFKVK